MTMQMFLKDAYLAELPARVAAVTEEGGIILDRSIFYPTGGGQPGDTGTLGAAGKDIAIVNTIKGERGEVVLIPSEMAATPPIGTNVLQCLDWERRLAHMRIHTALHLLSVVIPYPVTGGAITNVKGRLDFNMPEAPEDRDSVEDALNTLIAENHGVHESWISEEELAANPGLVKTMSVKPPTGAGQVRLVRIGTADLPVDLQPCGGTHVRSTAEIGPIRLGKIEKKGRLNRRVTIHLKDSQA